VIINKTTMGSRSGHRRDITPGQARLVTARFVLRQPLFFFLAEVPHFSHFSLVSKSLFNMSEQVIIFTRAYFEQRDTSCATLNEYYP